MTTSELCHVFQLTARNTWDYQTGCVWDWITKWCNSPLFHWRAFTLTNADETGWHTRILCRQRSALMVLTNACLLPDMSPKYSIWIRECLRYFNCNYCCAGWEQSHDYMIYSASLNFAGIIVLVVDISQTVSLHSGPRVFYQPRLNVTWEDSAACSVTHQGW